MDADDEEEVEVRQIKHFIYAADPGAHDGFYGLYTTYWETDALGAKGAVYRFFLTPEGMASFECALNTNDDLCSIWASPQGNLWVGSTWGHVWTTAAVPWGDSVGKVNGTQMDPHFSWKVTLGPTRPNGSGYNLAAIWGSSDNDVYFGTYSGLILHWDGSAWSVSLAENTSSIVRMHGTSASDVWAVGRDGLVQHFDGQRWRRIPLPGDATEGEALTGVWARSPEEVYICSSSGAIFHGSRRGLELLGKFPYGFYGIVEFEGRLILAAGNAGACELISNRVEVLRSSFAATGVYALNRRVGFVEPAQKTPRVVIHEPTHAKPWRGWGG